MLWVSIRANKMGVMTRTLLDEPDSTDDPQLSETTAMNVLIIGTGNMGRGIATRALAGKNTVTFHDQDAAKAQALAAELGAAVAGDTRDAISAADVVVFATPYQASLDVARRL